MRATGAGAKPYLDPYLAGAMLGVVLFAAFFLTGNGLGASGGIARVLVSLEDRIVPEHVDRTAYLLQMAGGERNPLDHWIVMITAGTLVGGFFSGLVHRRLRPETQRGRGVSVPTRLAFATLGGVLMGFGARLARGCTSGQALSGGAVLSVGSWAFMFSVFAGGYALAWFVRRLWIAED
ncbi:MAG: YeeE/YedE family protein [Gemmatimonadetes bacterium]|nr:YeeE/YedE family protein [Gemmatimonadota bacterium]